MHQGKFRIIDSLANLRETVSEVTVSLDDPLAQLPQVAPPAEVLSDQTEGRQRQMIVRDLDDTDLEQWKARPGVASVRVRSASLDELFAACVRGSSRQTSVSPVSTAEAMDVA